MTSKLDILRAAANEVNLRDSQDGLEAILEAVHEVKIIDTPHSPLENSLSYSADTYKKLKVLTLVKKCY